MVEAAREAAERELARAQPERRLLSCMPEVLQKKLPRYPNDPVARLAPWALDQSFGCHRTLEALAVYGIVVDAKDDEAIASHQHHSLVMSAEGRVVGKL